MSTIRNERSTLLGRLVKRLDSELKSALQRAARLEPAAQGPGADRRGRCRARHVTKMRGSVRACGSTPGRSSHPPVIDAETVAQAQPVLVVASRRHVTGPRERLRRSHVNVRPVRIEAAGQAMADARRRVCVSRPRQPTLHTDSIDVTGLSPERQARYLIDLAAAHRASRGADKHCQSSRADLSGTNCTTQTSPSTRPSERSVCRPDRSSCSRRPAADLSRLHHKRPAARRDR